MFYSDKELAKRIDHTLLKPEAGEASIRKLCQEACKFGFKAVCVHPCYVRLCVKQLSGSGVDIATVIGFPLGMNCTEIKALEAKRALTDGANEVDMVINIGALKDKKLDLVLQDILQVVNTSKKFPGTIVKVIIETALLTKEEKIIACELAVQAGAQYVKTSTGFGGNGATVEDIVLISETLKGRAKIKASGGIKTREQAEQLIAAGADRLGTSSGVPIILNADSKQ